MSTPRRRRWWFDVLRRKTGVGGVDSRVRSRSAAADDAALWGAHEQAARSLKESSARAERLAAAVARQRTLIESAAERGNVVAARAEGLSASASRVTEAFERLGVVALNAGLEGARTAEPQGRALLLLSEEIRANVRRGADAAEQVAAVIEEIAEGSAEARRQLERSRGEVSEVAQEAAHLQAEALQASRALDDLAGRLREATGIDPEMARAMALATEHARGLMTALSTLSMAAPTATVLRALRPVIRPLARLFREIERRAHTEGEERDEGEL
jgi:hypothetical protein